MPPYYINYMLVQSLSGQPLIKFTKIITKLKIVCYAIVLSLLFLALEPSSSTLSWALRHSAIHTHPKVYWINIDKSESRRLYMENQFSALGVNNQRVSAVEASSFEDLERNCSILEIPCRRNTPKDLATVMSHLKALKACIEDESHDEDFAIIMEDDVKLIYNIDFDKLIKSAPSPFGILQLGSSNPETITKHFFTFDSNNQSTYFTPNKWNMTTKKQGYALYWSAQYYLVNKTLAREKLPFLYHYVNPNPKPKPKNNVQKFSSHPNRNNGNSFGYHARSSIQSTKKTVPNRSSTNTTVKNSNSIGKSAADILFRYSNRIANNNNISGKTVAKISLTSNPIINRRLTSDSKSEKQNQPSFSFLESLFSYLSKMFRPKDGNLVAVAPSGDIGYVGSNTNFVSGADTQFNNSRNRIRNSYSNIYSNSNSNTNSFKNSNNIKVQKSVSVPTSGRNENFKTGEIDDSLQNSNSTTNTPMPWVLKYKIINSFYPEICKFTRAYPCVLANCIFADTYIYSLLSPTYVSAIPLVIGGKIGYESDLHQDHVYIHKLAFKIIHLIHDLMKNNSMISEVAVGPISRHQTSEGEIESKKDVSNVMPKSNDTIVIDAEVGEVYSRLINNENYRKFITSKGNVHFPSYIVSTIQN